MTLTLVTTSGASAECSSKDEGACDRNERTDYDLHEHSYTETLHGGDFHQHIQATLALQIS